MLRAIISYKHIIVSVLVIIIPIISIYSSRKKQQDLTIFDKGVIHITGPVQSAISFSIDGIIGVFSKYLYLMDTKRDNQRLSSEIQNLEGKLAKFRETELENNRLKELLVFEQTIPFKKLVAQVVGMDSRSTFRTIRINKGANVGIMKGMPVVTAQGIVGRIIRTTPGYSDVLTILDVSSAVDSIIERSRARGILEGHVDNFCILKYTLRTDDAMVGDNVVTSGLAGVFPKGVMLGRISKIKKLKYGITQNIEVIPSVNFDKLEEVLVILNY